jgi:sugar/nucleoside kinase (ribokinase family)
MKILIIGHSVVDHINNEIKPGGIYYSATGLYNFKDKDDEISLLTSFSDDSYFHFESLYSRIDIGLSQKVKEIPTVFLKIHKTKERDECYLNLTDKLFINPGINFNEFDGILINMITGFDIDLEDLKTIRSKFSGPIYFDVHTFSRGMDENHKRKFRKIPNAGEWVSNIDILQANETEIQTLSDESDLDKIIDEVFDYGLKLLIITKGEKGTSIYFIEKSVLKTLKRDALPVNSINSVGCGDIFGAVFFYSYIRSYNLISCLENANTAAGVSTTYKSFEEYKSLKYDTDRFVN